MSLHTAFAPLLKYPALLVVVAGALLLRVANINWGVPLDAWTGMYHPDEWKISSPAVHYPGFILRNTDFRYPTFFHNLNGVLFLPFRGVMTLLGVPEPKLYIYSGLLARSISVVAGTVTVYICYLVARRLHTHASGLVAAAICATSLYHVIDSGYSTTDVLSSCVLAVLLLQLTALYVHIGCRRRIILAGITFGVLVGTKYTGGIALLLILPLFVWTMLHAQNASAEHDAPSRGHIFVSFCLMAAAAFLAFLLTTPGILLKLQAFFDSLNDSRTAQAQHADRGSTSQLLAGMISDYVMAFGIAIIALYVLSIGVVLRFSRPPTWQRVFIVSMIALVALYTLFLGRSLLPRYLILVVPTVAVTVASAWQILRTDQPRWVTNLASGLVVLTIAYSAVHCLQGVSQRHGDTRTEAAKYLDANVPPGTRIALSYDTLKYGERHAWRRPIVNFTEKFERVDLLDAPDLIVTSSLDTDNIELILSAHDATANGRSGETSTDAKQPGKNNQIVWYRGAAAEPEVLAFYAQLWASDSDYSLEAEFKKTHAVPISFPSPVVRIYKRNTE